MKLIFFLFSFNFCMFCKNKKFSLCNTDVCDEKGGYCVDQAICRCFDNFTTIKREENNKLCNYERYNSFLTAFLELVAGFGVGHFYTQRRVNGLLKFSVYTLLCSLGNCAVAIAIKLSDTHPREDVSPLVRGLFSLCGHIYNFLLFWQALDAILFVSGRYKDGNGVNLF